MSIFSSIWDIIWWFFTAFVFVAYLLALFSIISDLFRDRTMGGSVKAIWFIFLIFLPFLTAVVYLIVRGRGMGERSNAQVTRSQEAAESYIRSVAAPATPTDEIARAHHLLADGAITPEEYATLKSAALTKASA